MLNHQRPLGVITIDGPTGAGKSSVARGLAQRLGILYLDTGSIYRAVALALHEEGIESVESPELRHRLDKMKLKLEGGRVLLDDRDMTDLIRTPEVSALASKYSALPSVRAALLDLQRSQALQGSLVADGRDMGTVVFPLAAKKFFLTASLQARAQRRFLELQDRGEKFDFEQLKQQIAYRDEQDSTRALSPLKQAEDSIYVDSSELTLEQVIDRLESLVKGEDNVA